MKISILTLFPELYEPFLKTSIIGKAQEKGLISANLINYLDFCEPKERIDSPTFGHGAGMLFKPEIVEKAIELQEIKNGPSFKIFFSPQGKRLNQKNLKEITSKILEKGHVQLITSRYEGMDARVEQYYADEIISVGDFVLMGGDLPAMAFLEAFLRLIPGIVGKSESVEKESFSGPFLDYPEYTAPVVWKNMEVPEVLRSGNHALMNKWRLEKAAEKTVKKNFEWLRSFELKKEEKELCNKYIPEHFVALMHTDVIVRGNETGNTSVTSIDIHDIARSSETYNLKNYFIVTPLEDQKKIIITLLDFWKVGYGAEYNPHRHQSIQKVKLNNNIDEVIEDIKQSTGKTPLLIATSARRVESPKYITFYDQARVWALNRPVLFLLGTGSGLNEQIINRCDFILDPIESFSEFNHLSVRSAAAIIFDRWLGIQVKN